jgi:hypothetical protein
MKISIKRWIVGCTALSLLLAVIFVYSLYTHHGSWFGLGHAILFIYSASLFLPFIIISILIISVYCASDEIQTDQAYDSPSIYILCLILHTIMCLICQTHVDSFSQGTRILLACFVPGGPLVYVALYRYLSSSSSRYSKNKRQWVVPVWWLLGFVQFIWLAAVLWVLSRDGFLLCGLEDIPFECNHYPYTNPVFISSVGLVTVLINVQLLIVRYGQAQKRSKTGFKIVVTLILPILCLMFVALVSSNVGPAWNYDCFCG